MMGFSYNQGELECDEVPLSAIAQAEGTPTYVYSANMIRRRYRELDAAFDGYPHRLHYALKANSTFALAEHIEAAGLRPVIAHPERTEAVLDDPFVAEELALRGWALQVNATSLTGRHGPEPEALGWSLVERGFATIVGSDGHRTTRPAHLDDAYRLARQRLGEGAISLFDGSALGLDVTQSRTASRAVSRGA